MLKIKGEKLVVAIIMHAFISQSGTNSTCKMKQKLKHFNEKKIHLSTNLNNPSRDYFSLWPTLLFLLLLISLQRNFFKLFIINTRVVYKNERVVKNRYDLKIKYKRIWSNTTRKKKKKKEIKSKKKWRNAEESRFN